MSKEPKPKYWICSSCADKKKWKCTENAITVIMGICGYCKEEIEQTLIPIVDFNKPNSEKAVWD